MTQALADPTDDRPAASPPDPAVPGTTPTVVAVVVVGVALTGMFLMTGDRWEGSAAARVPAVVSVLSFPALAAGTVCDASLVGLDGNAERVLLGAPWYGPAATVGRWPS